MYWTVQKTVDRGVLEQTPEQTALSVYLDSGRTDEREKQASGWKSFRPEKFPSLSFSFLGLCVIW